MGHGANNGSPSSPLSAPGSELVASGSVLPAPSSLLPTEEFWALKGVNFEVKQGEVLGIIGRNGAGKTTLLKILSRITEPTEGRVRIRGRVASLLEVGTGFHPELTGRENIFLNGAILGMSREEIKRKFDQIVDFSGVEKFIDTPVKRYSSGMYVRLAFAVAAHLEPEILIVDEVLAVGDFEFQKRCLGKMNEVATGGRTVLFVSHNMTAVEGLCTKGIVLTSGKLALQAATSDAVVYYLKQGRAELNLGAYSRSRTASPDSDAYFFHAGVYSGGIFSGIGYRVGAPLEFRVSFRVCRFLRGVALGIGINSSSHGRITTLHSERATSVAMDLPPGLHEFRCAVENLLLAPGRYQVKLSLDTGNESLQALDPAFEFDILPGDHYKTGRDYGMAGIVFCSQDWTCSRADVCR
jgi:lipopolysaccharide transport system ATP-binding protein